VPIIVHTSDVYLGAALGWLGPRAGEQREQLQRTLSKVIDLAIDQHADALVLSGNLFDSNNPSAAAVRFALKEFGRLSSESAASIVLLPGSRDFLDIESAYTSYRDDFGRIPRLSVLGLDGTTSVEIPEAGLSIHGAALDCKSPAQEQLDALEATGPYPFKVATVHEPRRADAGPPPDAEEEDDGEEKWHELSPQDGWSYVALGGTGLWQQQGGAVPVVSPGSPELVSPEQSGWGHVARVELRASGAIVSKVRVGTRSLVECHMDVTGLPDAISIADGVRHQALSNPQAVLKLVLKGFMSADSGVNDGRLVEELANDYFFVCEPIREYHVELSDQDLAQLPERLVVGRFARHMQERLAQAQTEDERREIEDAMQLGVALLQGKDAIG
jgi:DNA repair exonuclease SbcCD nuclease subunit